jgi:hypothetical protein
VHVPGVHVIAIVVGLAVPEQACGPLSAILPSVVTEPAKPLNGGANASAHSFSVTTAFCPTSDASQCAVTFHVPDTSGHVAPPALEDDDDDDGDDELELPHALSRRSAAHTAVVIDVIGAWYSRSCVRAPRVRDAQ